jgi:hypothetical protein
MNWINGHRGILITAVVGFVVAVGTFFAGAGSKDEHTSEIASLEGEVAKAEKEAGSVESELAGTKTELEQSEVERGEAVEALEVETEFKSSSAKQEASAPIETDYQESQAGRVGEYIFKPTGIDETGDGKWTLTVEAKNTGSSPLDPFCGGGDAILIDKAGNEYTGEAELFHGGANCGESLQPGLTASYLTEFHMPSGAVPVAAYIYGEFELEEEGKIWALSS